MSIKEQVSAHKHDIAIVIVLVLLAVGMAYRNGWLSPSTPNSAPVGTEISASQPLERARTKPETDVETLKTKTSTGHATQ